MHKFLEFLEGEFPETYDFCESNKQEILGAATGLALVIIAVKIGIYFFP